MFSSGVNTADRWLSPGWLTALSSSVGSPTVTEAELMQLATEVWQTELWMLCSSIPVYHHHTSTSTHPRIPPIPLALMAKQVWKWQPDTSLTGKWYEIFPVILMVDFSLVTTERGIQLVNFQTYLECMNSNHRQRSQRCAQTLRGAIIIIINSVSYLRRIRGMVIFIFIYLFP